MGLVKPKWSKSQPKAHPRGSEGQPKESEGRPEGPKGLSLRSEGLFEGSKGSEGPAREGERQTKEQMNSLRGL